MRHDLPLHPSSSRNIFVLAYAARRRACGEDWSGSGQHWKNRKLNEGDIRQHGGSIRSAPLLGLLGQGGRYPHWLGLMQLHLLRTAT